MKTAFLTLLGTSAAMGNVILSDTDSTGLAIYTTQRDNPVGFVKGSVNNLPELLDDAGNVLTGPTMSCVKIDSSTTRLETGTDVRPNRADFRGNHTVSYTHLTLPTILLV